MFTIKKAENGQAMVTYKGSNGNVLNSTETFDRHAGAITNIKSTMRGHGSSKAQKIVDEIKNITYMLRLEGGNPKYTFTVYNEKPLRKIINGK